MNPEKTSESHWTIEELAQRANKALSNSSNPTADSRMASEVSVRNLRRLVSIGAVSPPARSGREAYYGPSHLCQILEARELMSKGFTSSSIQAMRSASLELDKRSVGAPDASSAILAKQFQAQPEALRPSTAAALSFLDELSGSKKSYSPKSAGLAPNSANAFALSFSPSGHAFSTNEPLSLSHSADFGAFDEKKQWLGAASNESRPQILDLAKAYHALAPQKKEDKYTHGLPKSRSIVETEPFEGLLLTLQAGPALGHLTPEKKKAALDALSAAWLAAGGST